MYRSPVVIVASLAPGFVSLRVDPMQLVPQTVDRGPEVRHLEAQYNISLSDCRRCALSLIERVQRRKIHASSLINHGRLKRLGEFDQQGHARRASAPAVGNQDGTLGSNQKSSQLRDGALLALRRSRHRQFWNRQLRFAFDGVLLKTCIQHKDYGGHRWRHCDPVCANSRLAEMNERRRLIVPLGVVANHRGTILHTVVPLRRSADCRIDVIPQA
jgi:hypothetical protein